MKLKQLFTGIRSSILKVLNIRGDEKMVEEYSDDEYSDNEFDEILAKVIEWDIAFSESNSFKELTEEQKQESEFIVLIFTKYMYFDHGLSPEEWDEYGLEECCLDTLPTKVTAEESSYRSIAPVLSAFFDFLGEKGLLRNASELRNKVKKMNKQIIENSSDPKRWGVAKSMLMGAVKSGVDIENQNELNKFMYNYSLEQLETLKNEDNIKSIPESKPKLGKIGRNYPCPCGSGKKYKKCCGRS